MIVSSENYKNAEKNTYQLAELCCYRSGGILAEMSKIYRWMCIYRKEYKGWLTWVNVVHGDHGRPVADITFHS